MFKLLIFICIPLILFSNEKVNINFKNLQINELIKITSKLTNKNILLSDEIKGKVDFISNKELSKQELFKLLNKILLSKGYVLKKHKSFYEVKQKKKKENKANSIKSKKYKNSKLIKLLHSDIDEVSKIVKELIDKNFKDKISFSKSKSSNTLILYGYDKEIKVLENIINDIDKEKSQIYVEAKFIELNNSLLNEVGFKYGLFGLNTSSNSLSSFSLSLNDSVGVSLDGSSSFDISKLKSGIVLKASISLLHSFGVLDIVSEPSLLTLNNIESSIYVGETISLKTSSTISDGGVKSEDFKREDVGLTLKVKPRIIDSKKVLLKINTVLEDVKTINTISGNANTLKKQVQTTAILNDGESVVIGGLIENKENSLNSKVPYVSDVPLLGELFKHKEKNTRTKSLVIVVTPHIIPKSKDLTFIRSKLSWLKNLEEEYLKKSINYLNEKKEKDIKEEKDDSLKWHERRVKQILG